jgi:hypothetical protein
VAVGVVAVVRMEEPVQVHVYLAPDHDRAA